MEHPETPEKQRGFGPYYEGISTFFFSPNRGKRSICIDLKQPEGADLVRKLAREVDVVTENFRPGSMDRLGLGYEALREENPRLIYAALSGFGQSGPYSQMPAVDAVAQAMGGTMSLNGERNGPADARGREHGRHGRGAVPGNGHPGGAARAGCHRRGANARCGADGGADGAVRERHRAAIRVRRTPDAERQPACAGGAVRYPSRRRTGTSSSRT
ncbi:MAG: CoA transferase [Dehalococcoidia bacterium]|nr:CoA transferase [Dehalococcoidia bacterium]